MRWEGDDCIIDEKVTDMNAIQFICHTKAYKNIELKGNMIIIYMNEN